MRIQIKETGEFCELSIVDNHGIDWTSDFLGNFNALSDGQFVEAFDSDGWALGYHIADQATYDWWDRVIAAQQHLSHRIAALAVEHGIETVNDIIQYEGSVDIEDDAAYIHGLFDEAFPS